ncbi:hypothetical protein TNCT_477111 [Trichonephila clavata]|uniref:Uncharacterized protein n=1 Tax=Trichonephila clavata TaxID=2740835 RepID=A0A8X6J8F3_TRICU|nr:hypothetical protein TNCT_477111 [Trichonephila clavata]
MTTFTKKICVRTNYIARRAYRYKTPLTAISLITANYEDSLCNAKSCDSIEQEKLERIDILTEKKTAYLSSSVERVQMMRCEEGEKRGTTDLYRSERPSDLGSLWPGIAA